MSIFDPAVAAQAKLDQAAEEAQKIPPLNPPFPYRVQQLDPFELSLDKPYPKPIDNPTSA